MKILFLTRRAWPEIGGVEKHVLEVSKELVKQGHEVTVVSEDDGSFSRSLLANRPSGLQGETFGTVRTHKITVGVNEKLKKFEIWKWLFKHRDLIKGADLVHAHDVGFWYWPFRFLYPGKPFFMTFHGWEEKFPVPFKNKIVRKISEKMAKGNICVGEYLQKWYGTRADYVIYGGVDVSPRRSHGFTNVQPATFEVGPRKTIELLFIGRLEKETGIMTYLRAINILNFAKSFIRSLLAETPLRLRAPRGQGETFKTTILGDGPLRNRIEQYIKENKLNTLVLGFVDDQEKYLQKARFVFTSGYLSILEAMAAKKLVFSVFENPLKEDYLKMTPFKKFIIICQTPEELAKKIRFYLKNPQKEKKMTETAYNWVKGQTWEKVAEKYIKLWKRWILDTCPPMTNFL